MVASGFLCLRTLLFEGVLGVLSSFEGGKFTAERQQSIIIKRNLKSCSGIFSAILGRGPRAFLIGKISDITQNLGIFQNIQRL